MLVSGRVTQPTLGCPPFLIMWLLFFMGRLKLKCKTGSPQLSRCSCAVPHVVPVVNPERFKVQGEKIHHFPEQKSHLRPYKQPKNTSETWLVCEPTWTAGSLFGERHPRGEDFELNNNVGERRSQWFFMIVFSQKWQAPGNTGFKILQGFFQDIFHTTTQFIHCCFFCEST